MSDSDVFVPYGQDAAKTATLLLAAAEDKHQDQSLVRAQEGGFLVPKDVADEAGVDYDSDEDEQDDGKDDGKDSRTPAKKTAPPAKK